MPEPAEIKTLELESKKSEPYRAELIAYIESRRRTLGHLTSSFGFAPL